MSYRDMLPLPIRRVLGSDFYWRTLVELEDGSVWRDDWDSFTKRSHWIKVKEGLESG